MHLAWLAIVFLANEATENNCASLFEPGLVCEYASVTRVSHRVCCWIQDFKLLEESCDLELLAFPLHREFLSGNQLLLANAQHLVPSEARNFRLGVTLLIYPAWTGFYEQVAAIGYVLLQDASLGFGQHQRIGH